MKDIIENNILIAKFMYPKLFEEGVKPMEFIKIADVEYGMLYTRQMIFAEDIYNNEPTKNKSFMLYHSSWDWLMKVVEKIELMGYRVSSKFTECVICDINYHYNRTFISEDSKLHSIYTSVVEFIKWYNENK